MRRIIFFLFLLIVNTSAFAQRYYWVGDGDKTSWGDIQNWSTTSGGVGGAAGGITSAPANTNTVVFNQYSKLINTGTVSSQRRVDISGAVQCDSLIVENCTANTLPVFCVNSSSSIILSGSLFLQAGTSFGNSGYTNINFVSGRPQETIQTNGVNLYYAPSWVSTSTEGATFNGSAEYKLVGNANFQGITINSGVFNLNGYNVSCHSVTINSGGEVRFVGSVIDCRYQFMNAGVTLNAAQTAHSLIRVGVGSFTGKSTDVFNNIEIYEGNPSNAPTHSISGNARYNKITLLKGNTRIYGLITDSLVISAATATYVSGAITVNKYLEAKPAVCGGQVRLAGSSGATAANRTITMGTSSNVVIERAVIHDLIITGTTANAAKSYDWGNNSGFIFTTSPDAGRDMYWTGGGGYWGDPVHWSLTSDGLTPANCIPTLADNVFFNVNANVSGTAISSTNPVYMNMDAWCNNMTWNGVPGSPVFNITGNTSSSDYHPCTDNIMIGGSLTLQSSLKIVGTYYSNGGSLYFVSNRPTETITTNGCYIYMDAYFQSVGGTGKWTLMDHFSLFGNGQVSDYRDWKTIYFNRGHLDFNGKNVIAYSFVGNSDNAESGFFGLLSTRTLNMANSTIDLKYRWIYTGGQQLTALQSNNSSIIVGYSNSSVFHTKTNDYYNNVKLREVGGSIQNTSLSGTSFFNKIDLSCSNASVDRTSGGIILPDSLLFTGYGTYTIARSLVVNKYIGTSTDCGGYSIITATSPVTFTIGTVLSRTERVKIRNAAINNVSITPDTPYNIIDCTLTGTSNGWSIVTLPPETYYWVGGTGNWSENANWSLISGLNGGFKGDGTGCVPRPTDNVIFDDGSFSAPGQTVTVDKTGYCDSMTWRGSESLKPVFIVREGISLYINGSLEFQKGMIANNLNYQYGFIYFTSSRPNETIKSNGVNFNYCKIYFNGTGGWKFLDEFKITHSGDGSGGSVYFYSGSLNFNEQNVTIQGFQGNGTSPGRNNRFLDIRNSTINMSFEWFYTGDLQAENSGIFLSNYGNFIAEQNAPYYNLTRSSNTTSYIQLGKFNKITVRGDAIFNNTATDYIETDTLQLANNSNYTYKFYSGSTLRVNKAFYGSGTPCYQIYLQSTAETTPAIFDIKRAAANYDQEFGTDAADTLLIDYAYIHGIRTLTNPDNALLYKGTHSPDVNRSSSIAWGYGIGQNNYNQYWVQMDPYTSGGSSPFPADKKLPCNALPYRLSSVNFLPTPQSTFKWRVGSISSPVIGTDADLLIHSEGQYVLTVDYGNGCISTDSIIVNVAASDSLIWTGAIDQNWNHSENWEKPASKGGGVADFAPDICTDVLIPAGLSRYPDLLDGLTSYSQEFYEQASCRRIWFEHGGEVARTDSLHYHTAFVDLTVEANRWYMLSAPLKSTYSGDYYVDNPNPLLDFYNSSTDKRGLLVHMMHFNVTNYQTGINSLHEYGWSGGFNTNDTLLYCGQGFAFWANPRSTAYTDHPDITFRFPKHDLYYNYYAIETGAVSGRGSDLNRTHSGRFIYENDDKTVPSGGLIPLHPLTTPTSDNRYVLVGNPFMSHLDFSDFYLVNTGKIADGYKLAYGIGSSDGYLADLISYQKVGSEYLTTDTGDSGNDRRLIPPMQSFIVTSLTSGLPVLVADINSTTTFAGNTLRSGQQETQLPVLYVTANRGNQKSKSVLAFWKEASSVYIPAEDSRKLFPKDLTDPVLVYLNSSDGVALDINVTGALNDVVPIGIRTSSQGSITLTFSGMESFPPGTKMFFHDTEKNKVVEITAGYNSYSFDKTTDELYVNNRFYLNYELETGIQSSTQSFVSVTNPESKIIRIISDAGNIEKLEICNIEGKVLFKEADFPHSSYDFRVGSNGIYVVKIQGDQFSEVKKIIVK